MKSIQRIAVILLLSLGLLACSGGTDEAGSSKGTASGTGAFPAMGVAELDDFLKANTGTPTIAMVWTTWCPSCKQALPELEALNKSHGDQVSVMAISVDESSEALEEYFADKALDLPVYHGDEALARKFGIQAIPTMLIFDKNGQLVMNEAGVFPHSMLTAMVNKLVAK